MRFLCVLLISLTAASTHAQEQRFADLGSCSLDGGGGIEGCRIAYRTFGERSGADDNTILIPTWFSGTSADWLEALPTLLGEDHGFHVVVVDALANGVSVSPSNSAVQPGDAFPQITIGDMVRTQHRLVTEVLGLSHLHAVVGMSMGGMQAFEWAVLYPDFMDEVVPIIGSPQLGAYDVALWETWKRVLLWQDACRCAEAAEAFQGLLLLIASTPQRWNSMMTPEQIKEQINRAGASDVEGGSALDAVRQADAMMSTDVTRAYDGDWDAAAQAVQAKMLVVVDSGDHVVTPQSAIDFADRLGDRARVVAFDNGCGHMARRCERFRLRALVREFLRPASP